MSLQARRCEEPCAPYLVIDPEALPEDAAPAYHPADHWSLQPWCPAAANAVYRDTPLAIIWHFQLTSR